MSAIRSFHVRAALLASSLLALLGCEDAKDSIPQQTWDASNRSPDDDAARADAGREATRRPDASRPPPASETSPVTPAPDAQPFADSGVGGEPADRNTQSDDDVDADPLNVRVAAGALHGLLVGKTRKFLGIPYAEPPLGQLRFAAPRPVAPWQGTREATGFGPSCRQLGSQSPLSEDCLTLNVFAPGSRSSKGLPVMVFIHGGGFVLGTGATYDAQALREAGEVVVVTINYRLGPFGFLTHPALGDEHSNQAIRDQQLALRWVRDNAAAFGGDPAHVTVFGESAGSIAVCTHLFASGSEGLGQRFIMESGSCTRGPFGLQSHDYAIQAGQALVAELCPNAADVAACLRALPPEKLQNYVYPTADRVVDGWWPFIDGQLFPDTPEALIAQGRVSDAPFIVGTNLNEWRLMQDTFIIPKFGTRALLGAEIDALFPKQSAAIKAFYLPATDAAANDAYLRMMTHAYFRCPSRALVRGLTGRGNAGYLYSFEIAPAAHSLDVDYVFNVFGTSWYYLLEAPVPLNKNMVDAIQSYWTNFARAGQPNDGRLFSWPAYEISTDRHVVLRDPISASSELSRADCDFWDTL